MVWIFVAVAAVNCVMKFAPRVLYFCTPYYCRQKKRGLLRLLDEQKRGRRKMFITRANQGWH
jgi:hypothetical protein